MKLKELFTVRDMTEGEPWKRILEFALPMLAGNIAQQLYNTADTIIVGKYVGDNALSAVGSAGPIMNLMLSIFMGISTGAGIVTAQYFGAKDRDRLSTCIGNCLTLSTIAALFIMVFGTLLSKPLLELLETPDSIISWCESYLRIVFLGIFGAFMYNMLSGILRGMGDSFSALGFLLIATVLNVGLDLLFVAKFGMGVPGVALATIIAQAISAVCCYAKLVNMREVFYLNRQTIKIDKPISGRIITLGVPSAITMGVMAAAGMVVQALTNSMGEMVIACSVVVMRVDGFAMMPNMTFGQAMSVYTGQNVGARKFDRMTAGTKQGLIIALCTSTVITVILLFFGKGLMALFTDTPALIGLANRMMRILAVGYICIAATQVLGGVMRGAGDTVTPMWISIISTIVLRMPIAYGLAYLTRTEEFPNGQPKALFFSLLIAWVLGMVMSVVMYKLGRWKRKLPREQELEWEKS